MIHKLTEEQIRYLFRYYLNMYPDNSTIYALMKRAENERNESHVKYTVGEMHGYLVGAGLMSWGDIITHVNTVYEQYKD